MRQKPSVSVMHEIVTLVIIIIDSKYSLCYALFAWHWWSYCCKLCLLKDKEEVQLYIIHNVIGLHQ